MFHLGGHYVNISCTVKASTKTRHAGRRYHECPRGLTTTETDAGKMLGQCPNAENLAEMGRRVLEILRVGINCQRPVAVPTRPRHTIELRFLLLLHSTVEVCCLTCLSPHAVSNLTMRLSAVFLSRLPLATEILSVFDSSGRLVLNKTGKRISLNIGEIRETSFLFQRVSVLMQRFSGSYCIALCRPRTKRSDRVSYTQVVRYAFVALLP